MDVDTGISRKLPEKQPEDMPEPPKLKEKNVFVVTVNRNNDILVEGETFMTIDKIREEAIKFIDNGGGLGNPINGAEPAECDWCEGAKDPASSDHPNKAIISLESDRGTSYGTYIAVQNELVGAYTDLRDRLSKRKSQKSIFRINISIFRNIYYRASGTDVYGTSGHDWDVSK